MFKKAISLYSNIVDEVVEVSNIKIAEMAKIVENTYRSVNIALVNELKIVADSVGIDIYEVIDAALIKAFLVITLYPGPGIGGHCIPIDPYYLLWKAEKMQVELSVVKQASKVNNSMPDFK